MADQADITRAVLAAQRAQALANAYASKALQAANQARTLYDQALRFSTVWRGTWDSATAYILNDMVENGGSSYICIVQNSNQEPPNPTYWELVAQSGSAVFSVNSVNRNGTTLTAFDSSGSDAGDLIYVETVGAYFKLSPASALTVDNITVVDASGLPGSQWVRENDYNAAFEAQTTWFIDPQNTYGTSHDENDGLTSATALISYKEHARRLADATISSAVITTVRSNFNSGDEPTYTFYTRGSGTVTFEGVLTDIFTGTITTWTPAVTTAAADDNQMVSATIPTSWTASGLLADAVLFRRTNGTANYWWACKDLGGAAPDAAVRTSLPIQINGGTGSITNGDSFAASTIPTIGAVKFQNATRDTVILRFLNSQDTTTIFSVPHQRQHCWGIRMPNINHINCGIGAASSITFSLDGRTISPVAGMIRGNGNVSWNVTGPGRTAPFALTLQGVGNRVTNGAVMLLSGRLTVHDVTGGGLGMCNVESGGYAGLSLSGCLGGKGNTGTIVNIDEGVGAIRSQGLFRSSVTTPFVAASTSLSQCIVVNNIGYTVAQLPLASGSTLNITGGNDFPGSSPGMRVANGTQAVTIGSSGPAAMSAPANAAGWETFYDNSGQLCYRPFWK